MSSRTQAAEIAKNSELSAVFTDLITQVCEPRKSTVITTVLTQFVLHV